MTEKIARYRQIDSRRTEFTLGLASAVTGTRDHGRMLFQSLV